MLTKFLHRLKQQKGDLWLLSAKWTAPIFSLLGGLIAAKNLHPEELGAFHVVMLIPTYAGILHCGVFNGLSRNLPLYRARGNIEKSQRYINGAAVFSKVLGTLGVIIALAFGLFFHINNTNPNYTYLALFLVSAMFFGPLKLHQDVIYRSMRQFDRLGKNVHAINIWAFLCSLSTSFLGVTGMAIRIGTLQLLGWLLLLRKPPLKAEGPAELSEVRELATVGFPIMFSGLLFIWLSATDRTVVATFLGAEDVGHYALAGMAAGVVLPFTASINMLLAPRVAHAYGATNSSRHLRRYIWIALGLNAVILVPLALAGWFAVPVVVHNFLPAYIPGIPAAQITLVAGLFSIFSGAGVVIPTLRRNLRLQFASAVAIALVWIGGMVAIAEGHGITGVAVARMIGFACYCVITAGYALYLTGREIDYVE